MRILGSTSFFQVMQGVKNLAHSHAVSAYTASVFTAANCRDTNIMFHVGLQRFMFDVHIIRRTFHLKTVVSHHCLKSNKKLINSKAETSFFLETITNTNSGCEYHCFLAQNMTLKVIKDIESFSTQFVEQKKKMNILIQSSDNGVKF